MDRYDESLSTITEEITKVSRNTRGSMCLTTMLRSATNLIAKSIPSTLWDTLCSIFERCLRIADDAATFMASDDQGRIDDTKLTPIFKRKDERLLKHLKN